MSRRLLILSTPVAPLGSGDGGGVERTVENLAAEFTRRGWRVEVAAPEGSLLDGNRVGDGTHKAGRLKGVRLRAVPGRLQQKAQHLDRDHRPVTPPDSVLTGLCRLARNRQEEFDLILNCAYDLLPLHITPLLSRPMGHLISMGSLYDAFDREMKRVEARCPGRFACHSRTQAATFPDPEIFTVVGNGIDLTRYTFVSEPGGYLLWTGRISPEKGVEDALEVARQTGIPLCVAGRMEQPAYWQKILEDNPGVPVRYEGFLELESLQKLMGGARALLMTPRWVEAFGIVAIEALACGLPVISYRRGGPAEIIRDGETGFLTPPDSPDGLITAISGLHTIDRRRCRKEAEERFSLPAWGDRLESWFQQIMKSGDNRPPQVQSSTGSS